MTEERDVEEIAGYAEKALVGMHPDSFVDRNDWLKANELAALIADWRAKKAEIERLYRDLGSLISAHGEAILQLEYLHERWPTGTGEAVLTRLRQNPPHPLQSTASLADSQDGQA